MVAREEAAAEQEIAEFGATELQKIITHGEEDRDAQLSAIDTAFKKNAAAVTASQLQRMTDASFLSQEV